MPRHVVLHLHTELWAAIWSHPELGGAGGLGSVSVLREWCKQPRVSWRQSNAEKERDRAFFAGIVQVVTSRRRARAKWFPEPTTIDELATAVLRHVARPHAAPPNNSLPFQFPFARVLRRIQDASFVDEYSSMQTMHCVVRPFFVELLRTCINNPKCQMYLRPPRGDGLVLQIGRESGAVWAYVTVAQRSAGLQVYVSTLNVADIGVNLPGPKFWSGCSFDYGIGPDMHVPSREYDRFTELHAMPLVQIEPRAVADLAVQLLSLPDDLLCDVPYNCTSNVLITMLRCVFCHVKPCGAFWLQHQQMQRYYIPDSTGVDRGFHSHVTTRGNAACFVREYSELLARTSENTSLWQGTAVSFQYFKSTIHAALSSLADTSRWDRQLSQDFGQANYRRHLDQCLPEDEPVLSFTRRGTDNICGYERVSFTMEQRRMAPERGEDGVYVLCIHFEFINVARGCVVHETYVNKCSDASYFPPPRRRFLELPSHDFLHLVAGDVVGRLFHKVNQVRDRHPVSFAECLPQDAVDEALNSRFFTNFRVVLCPALAMLMQPIVLPNERVGIPGHYELNEAPVEHVRFV
ncbi:MAG: hypothetical protein ACPGR8_12375 [Limisphaerales bacterium]